MKNTARYLALGLLLAMSLTFAWHAGAAHADVATDTDVKLHASDMMVVAILSNEAGNSAVMVTPDGEVIALPAHHWRQAQQAPAGELLPFSVTQACLNQPRDMNPRSLDWVGNPAAVAWRIATL
jgi:hypothetical protein